MSKMRIITVNIPLEMLKFIDSLVELAGIAPSRSEIVRMCLHEALPLLLEMYEGRQAIVDNIKTSKNFLTPHDVIFVKNNNKIGNGYTKYKVVGEA